MASVTQDHRQLAVFTRLPKDTLLLRRFVGTETISELFEYELEALSKQDDLQPEELVGQPITWRVDRDGEALRWFSGYVSSFQWTGRSDRFSSYRIEVVPWLWFLTQTKDCRIFQNRTTPQIIAEIFEGLGFRDFEFSLSEEYDTREYCVQYRETSFDFVSRLMEEEGLFYYFTHENGGHQLVIADGAQAWHDVQEERIGLFDQVNTVGIKDQLKRWQRCYELRSGRFAHKDFNHETPKEKLVGDALNAHQYGPSHVLEQYDFPGRFPDEAKGARLAKVRAEALCSLQDRAEGVSTYRSFSPGGKFQIDAHLSLNEIGKSYVLFQVQTQASVQGEFETGEQQESIEFENRFVCFPVEQAFRVPLKTPCPIVEGPQTATVVGPAGEEIHTDKQGRIRVQFHWDRIGSRNEKSSCWIRVSQTHAGQGWGTIDIPRINEEVVVSFLEGNPDRPIVKGRVYNAKTTAPFDLPGEMTRSGMKSNTHQGSGYNEVTMDDTKDKELVRIHAQHDMETTVGRNETFNCGNNSAESVIKDRSMTVGNMASKTTGSDEAWKIGTDLNIDAGTHLTLKAGTSITLTVGKSKIKMNQAGVIKIEGEHILNAAAVANTTVAPMSTLSGKKAMTTAGLFNAALGGWVKVAGKDVSVNGAKVEVEAKGPVVVQGCPIKLGEAGTPGAPLPGTGKGGGGGPSNPNSPNGTGSSGSGAGANQGDGDKKGTEVDEAKPAESESGKDEGTEHDCGSDQGGQEPTNDSDAPSSTDEPTPEESDPSDPDQEESPTTTPEESATDETESTGEETTSETNDAPPVETPSPVEEQDPNSGDDSSAANETPSDLINDDSIRAAGHTGVGANTSATDAEQKLSQERLDAQVNETSADVERQVKQQSLEQSQGNLEQKQATLQDARANHASEIGAGPTEHGTAKAMHEAATDVSLAEQEVGERLTELSKAESNHSTAKAALEGTDAFDGVKRTVIRGASQIASGASVVADVYTAVDGGIRATEAFQSGDHREGYGVIAETTGDIGGGTAGAIAGAKLGLAASPACGPAAPACAVGLPIIGAVAGGFLGATWGKAGARTASDATYDYVTGEERPNS